MFPDFGGHSSVASLKGKTMKATADNGKMKLFGIDVSESGKDKTFKDQ